MCLFACLVYLSVHLTVIAFSGQNAGDIYMKSHYNQLNNQYYTSLHSF